MSKDFSSPRERCAILCGFFCRNKYFLLILASVALGFYWFGVRQVTAVQECHLLAQQNARAMLQQRSKQSPQNAQLQQAVQAGMIAEEDYASAYKNCIRSRGYDLT